MYCIIWTHFMSKKKSKNFAENSKKNNRKSKRNLLFVDIINLEKHYNSMKKNSESNVESLYNSYTFPDKILLMQRPMWEYKE